MNKNNSYLFLIRNSNNNGLLSHLTIASDEVNKYLLFSNLSEKVVKQTNMKFICLLIAMFCFISLNRVEAAKTLDSKIFPITSNNYRKTPTATKKAEKKTNSQNNTTNNKIDDNTEKNFSELLSRIRNNSKTNTKTNTKNTTKDSKIISNSSIKINKPQNIKEEKTNRQDRIHEPILKVKLTNGLHTKVNVVFPDGGQITNSKGKKISTLKNGKSFIWTSTITTDKKSKKKKIEHLNETLTLKPSKNLFVFNGSEYRGKLILKITEKGAIAVNEISIEDYLRGVVGREIGANSPDESLKAQSVIARTYAYANRGRHGSEGADVCSTTHCQVYFGKSAERESVDKAIKDTRGYILTYNSNPISALYHATCGGMTSNNEEVWGGTPEPFLRRVNCDFCSNGTKYRWNQEILIDKLRTLLAKEGVKIGEIYDVSIEAPAKMDRVTNMVFQTKNGEQKVKGTTIRRLFDLPSTTFVLGDRNEKFNLIANAKLNKQNFNPNIYITTFTSNDSPKQLLVYTGKGLKRAIIPSDGWKIISYKPLDKGIAFLDKNEDNKDIGKKVNNKLKNQFAVNKSKKSSRSISKINLFGRGFGHQVGLCQSGAVEMGKKGWNYRQILAHYYQGVALKKLGY